MSARFLVVGHGARETSMAKRLVSELNEVCAYTIHENHGLTQICGPQHVVLADSYDPENIISAAKDFGAEIIVPGHESALYEGLTEKATLSKIKVFGPSQAVCRLERDKTYSREIAGKIDGGYLVKAETFFSTEDALGAICRYPKPFVLKCWDSDKQNYQTRIVTEKNDNTVEAEVFQAVFECNSEQNPNHPPIIIEEFIEGHDCSIYVVTDGVSFSFSPSMQNYPFLCNGNTGPKTGGMGCVTAEKSNLPFLDVLDYGNAKNFIRQYLEHASTILGEIRGMYSFQFFKTKGGLKFNEIDVRPGDPEMVNYLALLTSRFDQMIEGACSQTLQQQAFANRACVSVYLATPGYPQTKDTFHFKLDVDRIKNSGCAIHYGQTRWDNDAEEFTAIGSRALVISSYSKNVEECRNHIAVALNENMQSEKIPLRYRDDIGLTT